MPHIVGKIDLNDHKPVIVIMCVICCHCMYNLVDWFILMTSDLQIVSMMYVQCNIAYNLSWL